MGGLIFKGEGDMNCQCQRDNFFLLQIELLHGLNGFTSNLGGGPSFFYYCLRGVYSSDETVHRYHFQFDLQSLKSPQFIFFSIHRSVLVKMILIYKGIIAKSYNYISFYCANFSAITINEPPSLCNFYPAMLQSVITS